MIKPMSKFDYSDLDGRLLRLLLAVLDTGSVTHAAERLGVTQSAVSHLLDKLRAITGEALFVKSGRGIVATERAQALGVQARELLASMEQFAAAGQFDPKTWQTTFTVAANDFQRDVLLPPLMARLRTAAPGFRLHVVPSGVPSAELLRDGHCQLVVSPRPPDAADIMQKRLFEDDYRVFFDPQVRSAPATRAAYLAAEHITVVYDPPRALDLDQWLAASGIQRHFRVTVPGFAGLAPFIRGSALLATVPGRLHLHLMQGLGSASVPFEVPTMPMYMVWHKRYQQDPAHRWLRAQLEAVVGPAVQQA
jgi:DNA-binding transcriptional LysR family regulator